MVPSSGADLARSMPRVHSKRAVSRSPMFEQVLLGGRPRRGVQGRPQARSAALDAGGVSTILPISPYTSPHLPTSPHISRGPDAGGVFWSSSAPLESTCSQLHPTAPKRCLHTFGTLRSHDSELVLDMTQGRDSTAASTRRRSHHTRCNLSISRGCRHATQSSKQNSIP